MLDRFGRLDALVNNAGITGPKATLRESTDAIWEKVLRTNVIGLATCCREALVVLPQGGAIVNVSPAPRSSAAPGSGSTTPPARARWIR